MHPDDLTLPLADEAATLRLGACLAAALHPGDLVWLQGDLGAGKTTLVRGLLRAAGNAGPVKSPTYTLVEVHPVSGIYFYHFDFYRFQQAEEYLDAGLDEYFAKEGNATGICLVEWPDRAIPYLPAPDLEISLSLDGPGRLARLAARTPRGRRCLDDARSCATAPPS